MGLRLHILAHTKELPEEWCYQEHYAMENSDLWKEKV